MGEAGNAIAAGEIVSLCAMSADEAVKKASTPPKARPGSTSVGRTTCRRARSEVRLCGSSPGSTTGAKLVLSLGADTPRQK